MMLEVYRLGHAPADQFQMLMPGFAKGDKLATLPAWNLSGIRKRKRKISAGTRSRSAKPRRSLAIPSAPLCPTPTTHEEEDRYIIVGRSQRHRLLMVSQVERSQRTRIISARPLTPTEREAYEEEINR